MPRRSLADLQTDKAWPNRVNNGIGVEAFGRLALGTLDFGFFHRWRDRPDNALSHLVLQIEDVAETTIKPFCPDMHTGRGIDELSSNTHPVGGLLHTAFQHVTDTQLPANLLHVNGAAPIGKAGIAGDHK